MKKKQLAIILAGSMLMTNVVTYAEMANIEGKEDFKEVKIENSRLEEKPEVDIDFNDGDNDIDKDQTNDEKPVIADVDSNEDNIEEDKVDIEYDEDDNYFNDFLNDFFQDDKDEEDEEVPSYNNNNNGLGDFTFNYEDEDFEYFNPGESNNFFDDLGTDNEVEKETENNLGAMKAKKNKGPTIHYSLSSKNGVPLFIDTGLEVNKDESISQINIEELLRQISIRKKGKLFRDKDSFLLYINNDTIVISKDMYNVKGLEKAFKDQDIKFKFSTSQTGKKSTLVELLMTKGDIPVYIDNKKIELSVKPQASNELYVIFPIREIVEGLNAKITWNNSKEEVIISKDNKIIKLKNNSNIVTVNGKKYKLTAPGKLNYEAGRMLSLLSLIVDELGGVAYYDAHLAAITINSNK